MSKQRELSDEDQARVDAFTRSGIHSIERKPFRPLLLVLVVLAMMAAMTVLSIAIERTVIP